MHRSRLSILAATVVIGSALMFGCSDGPTGPADTTSPSDIINLTVVEAAGDSVVLTWSAPGDDGDSGAVSRYELRYAPPTDSTFDWETAQAVSFAASVRRPGAIEQAVVHGLDSTTTYRFAIRAYDEAGNESELSNIVDEYFVVIIPDPVLARELRVLVNREDSLPLHISDLRPVSVFRNESDSISDLRGLEHCVRLQSLYISNCPVSSLEPVARLPRMLGIYLTNTEVGDLRPVSGLTTLKVLVAQICRVKDISPVRSLTGLEVLLIGRNEVSDLRPVAELLGLRNLDVRFNNITDLRPIRGLTELMQLSISGDSVETLRDLAGLTELHYLTADYCGLDDLTALTDLPMLRRLELSGNHLTTLKPLVDNPGIGEGDQVVVYYNRFNPATYEAEVTALEARGVDVRP